MAVVVAVAHEVVFGCMVDKRLAAAVAAGTDVADFDDSIVAVASCDCSM